jgi:hypothetical protein
MIFFWLFAVLVLLFGFVAFFGAPYVPSLRKEVHTAFEDLYNISPTDIVVDLGSGDGLVLLEATARGAKGYGYELNPLLALISRVRLRGKATIYTKNMWQAELPSDVTLIYAFTVTRDSRKLGRFIQAEVNRLARPVQVMTFGAPLKDYEPIAERNAHSLYKVLPK